MNIWLYLPDHYYNNQITNVMGNTVNELFNNIESEVSEISKVGDVAEMPYDLLIEWLRLNNISNTGSEELDRQLFRRYYSLMKRRGTIGAISRVIESGGSMYAVNMEKFNYKIMKGTDKMMKYCRRMTDYCTFNPNMYCPGVFFIETTNINAVTGNPMLDKVFPAGCKYYVVRVLLPQVVVASISKIDYLREVDRHYFCNHNLLGIERVRVSEVNSYSTLIGDVFRDTWNYWDFNSYERIDGDSNFYLMKSDITISKETDKVSYPTDTYSISKGIEKTSHDAFSTMRTDTADLVKSLLMDMSQSPSQYNLLLESIKSTVLDLSPNYVNYMVYRDSYREALLDMRDSLMDLSVDKACYQVQTTDTYKEGFTMYNVPSMETISGVTNGVFTYPSVLDSVASYLYSDTGLFSGAVLSSERYLRSTDVATPSPLALLVKENSSEFKYYDANRSVWSYGTLGTITDIDSKDTNPVSSVSVTRSN